MECRELTGRVVDRLQGEADETALLILADHLAVCPRCATEADRIEGGWALLGRDPDAPVTDDFRRRSLELIEEEMLRRRIRSFRPRTRGRTLLRYAAAVLLAAAVGYFARGVSSTPSGSPAAAAPALAGKTELPDFDASPRLANVSFTAPDPQGRIGITFDTTSRQTIVGRPEDPAVARVLSYLVSGNAETAGGKTRAIELLSTHYGTSRTPASPEIVSALTSTLRTDSNPGVRKKAADALAGFRMTPEVRAAFLAALRSDRNPAVRLVAIEALEAAAREAPPDEATIESLREKAFDPSENGFVRAKAASALKAIDL